MRLELRQAIKAFMCLMIILVAIFIIITIKVTIDQSEADKKVDIIADELVTFVVEKNYEEIARLSYIGDNEEVTAEDVKNYLQHMDNWNLVSNSKKEDIDVIVSGDATWQMNIDMWVETDYICFTLKKKNDEWKIVIR